MTDTIAPTPEASPAMPDVAVQVRDRLAPEANRLRELCADFANELPPLEQLRDSTAHPNTAETLWKYSRKLVQAGENMLALAKEPPPNGQLCHQLRQPLNRASSACQLLLKTPGEPFLGHLQKGIKQIAEQIQSCLRIIEGLEPQMPRPPESHSAEPEKHPPALTSPRRTDFDKILLIDDDHESRMMIATLLRGDGHDVWEVGDGLQAIRCAESLPFDLVLLDFNLPGADGFTVLKRFRANPRMAAVPVLMFSGLNELDRVVACIEAGAEDFLVKPVEHILLQAKVKAFLQKRRDHRKVLEQFFSPEVARELIDRPELLHEARDAEVSVLFCDIRGFSRISERLGTLQTLAWVRSVMEELSDCVLSHRGVLVDFIGDELMAMWGAPSDAPDHAILACTAALAMIDRLPVLNARWGDRLGEPMDIGIGINSGLARVGNTGTQKKFKYGALGNSVNIASRIQGSTKYLKTRLIASQSVVDRLDRRFATRRLADVRVVNVREPLRLHEVTVLGLPGWDLLKTKYEKALRYYENRELVEAARMLSELINEHGAKGPELALMARTMEAMVRPETWAMVADLPGK